MTMENYHFTEIEHVDGCKRRRRVSWGAIFAGAAVVLAVSMLLSVLGTSIGLFILDPTTSQPFSGVFGTVGIWTAVSILVGLACGGFVAGKLAGADGFIHGFVVWSVTLIAGMMLVGTAAAGAVRLAGNVLGTAGNIVADAGGAMKKGIAALADEAETLFGDIDFTANEQELRADMRQALRRSGVREFQPEYLRGQYNAVARDWKKSLKRIIANPEKADDIINGFTSRLSARADKIAGSIDRNDMISLVVASNQGMSRAQAEDTADQYMELIEQGRDRMNELQASIQEAMEEWQVRKTEWLSEADKATNAAGWTGIITFIALMIGAAVCAFAGVWGTRKTLEGYEA